MKEALLHAAVHAASLIPAVDTPVDYSAAAGTIGTVLGGLGAGLGLVIAGALAIRGIRWGVPKIVGFFTRLS